MTTFLSVLMLFGIIVVYLFIGHILGCVFIKLGIYFENKKEEDLSFIDKSFYDDLYLPVLIVWPICFPLYILMSYKDNKKKNEFSKFESRLSTGNKIIHFFTLKWLRKK